MDVWLYLTNSTVVCSRATVTLRRPGPCVESAQTVWPVLVPPVSLRTVKSSPVV